MLKDKRYLLSSINTQNNYGILQKSLVDFSKKSKHNRIVSS